MGETKLTAAIENLLQVEHLLSDAQITGLTDLLVAVHDQVLLWEKIKHLFEGDTLSLDPDIYIVVSSDKWQDLNLRAEISKYANRVEIKQANSTMDVIWYFDTFKLDMFTFECVKRVGTELREVPIYEPAGCLPQEVLSSDD